MAERALVIHAERLVRGKRGRTSPMPDLVTRFATLGLPAAPYGLRGRHHRRGACSVSSRPTPCPVSEATPPILADSDWVALQGICGE